MAVDFGFIPFSKVHTPGHSSPGFSKAWLKIKDLDWLPTRNRTCNWRYDGTAMQPSYSRILVVLALGCLPLAVHAAAQRDMSFQALDLDAPLALDSLVSQLAANRVVFVGEIHTRYDHHLNQLEIIRRLHEVNPTLVIGVEYFQQRFQSQVDDYIAGRSTEEQFLRSIEYYRTWGYDYRLYAPIFRFAREQRIPVRALNVPNSLPAAVAKVGIAGLSERERASLPAEILPADEAYRARLRSVFEEHEAAKARAFDRFVEAQLVWDEGMAASAAAYLKANQGRQMVILAGSGHVAYGSGIPSRLKRRMDVTYAIVLSSGEEIEPQMTNYILLSKKNELPPAGALGVSLKDEGGECRIRSLEPAGAAEKAGMKQGDILATVDGQAVKTIADVRLALWDKKPGDRIRIKVRRRHRLGTTGGRDLEVELSAPGGQGAKP
jgi:uncharacterized iron-regulated protein